MLIDKVVEQAWLAGAQWSEAGGTDGASLNRFHATTDTVVWFWSRSFERSIFVFLNEFPIKVTQIHIIFDNHVQEGDWFVSLYLLTIDDFVSIALLFIFFFFLSLFFKRFIPIFNLSLVYLHMVSDIFECKLVLNEDGISTCYGIQILVRWSDVIVYSFNKFSVSVKFIKLKILTFVDTHNWLVYDVIILFMITYKSL